MADLSGAGVALKLVQALVSVLNAPVSIIDFFDMAALGTIADVVPLTGENRIIVKNGLPHIQNSARPGIKALMHVSGIDGRLFKAGRLSFSLIPRLNVAGRIGDPTNVVRLLTTDSDSTAGEIAESLNNMNAERQQIEEKILQDALHRLKDKDTSSAIVLSSEGWHQGVTGIVASRIAEKFYRPAVIFSIDNGIAKGSARSIPSFDICSALSACSELLISFGGHKQAAGVRLEPKHLPAFEKKLCAIFDSSEDIERTPILRIDADVHLSDINFNLIQELKRLEPFGYGNPEPRLGSKMLEAVSPRIVGNNHIKMTLRDNAFQVDAIGFDMGSDFGKIDSSAIDVVFTPSINEWNNNRYLQLILKAFRPSTA
jgi:single-stranded-DNA-specific exonuclease